MSLRFAMVFATMAAMAMLLGGCSLFLPSKDPAPAAQKTEMASAGPVVDAVKGAPPEFLQVEVGANQDGLTTGVVVDAEVPLGYVVTGEKLKTLLVAVWNSSDRKPAFVKFNPWSTYEGKTGAIKASLRTLFDNVRVCSGILKSVCGGYVPKPEPSTRRRSS
ncbi:hypothetical protein [Amycolatopsis azurea]|uniref:Lipoprotein n=1 Tax=Amycolatopsis azurea DSM 43854 TaxID=1238180 RepID=M2QJI8_9PSEU|nr:hypothetical protein [Amycolatopsis azurea]EMD26052.1 hypothetical protein C791_3994 [Amycolatopsis azurea DSM 43854]